MQLLVSFFLDVCAELTTLVYLEKARQIVAEHGVKLSKRELFFFLKKGEPFEKVQVVRELIDPGAFGQGQLMRIGIATPQKLHGLSKLIEVDKLADFLVA